MQVLIVPFGHGIAVKSILGPDILFFILKCRILLKRLAVLNHIPVSERKALTYTRKPSARAETVT